MRYLLLLILTSVAFAQEETNAPPNYAVQFYGANALSIPVYWPKAISSIGTNTTADPGWFIFTQEQLDNLKATNVVAFTLSSSNRAWIAKQKSDANLSRIIALFQQIPAARTQMTNIQSSTISNVSQASTHIKTMANVLDGILEELQRLGPVLKSIYKPEEDATP